MSSRDLGLWLVILLITLVCTYLFGAIGLFFSLILVMKVLLS